jgi:hypothetical protein
VSHGEASTTGQPWSSEEVRVVVEAYFWMLGEEIAGRPYVKSHLYQRLHDESLPTRSVKAIERKFQNVSAVMESHHLPWVKGLAPLRNVQTDLIDAVEARLKQAGWIEA